MEPRVLLVNMPFSSLRWPAIGPSLLKAGLEQRGIGCDLAYLNFAFAEAVGLERYDWLNDSFGFVLGGERVFAKYFFGNALPGDDDYFRRVLQQTDPEFDEQDRAAFEALAEFVEPFLETCFAETPWDEYALVGFTTTFQQTMPSLCLAQRVKGAHPGVQIAFGGANCEGTMGQELLLRFPFIDWVFSGESDETFPLVVKRLVAGHVDSLPEGVWNRDRLVAVLDRRQIPLRPGKVPACGDELPRKPPASAIVQDLDRLPVPDYTDYFARLEKCPFQAEIAPYLLFETSRGCWWGMKQQCTFCGLNGATMLFRSKSPRRAVAELQHLSDRYHVRRACATDNIMDFRYFSDFLHLLQDGELNLELEYELKTNLTRSQVRALVDAGLRAAQLGVESFSTPILRLMRKGATAVQNLQTLKWMTEAGIEVKWNFLYGIPGENPDDYDPLPELLAKLAHLVPPQAAGPVRIDRFSPYYETPSQFGLSPIRPLAAYRHVYPFAEDRLARLAYYFETDETLPGRTPAYVKASLAAIEDWRGSYPQATLRQSEQPDGTLILLDTRPCAAAFQHWLTGIERDVYLYCDSARSWPAILNFARREGMPAETGEADLRQMLGRWIAEDIAVELDGRFLSLALETQTEL